MTRDLRLTPVFSYGINTNIDSLRSRCPRWAGLWEPATLPDYRMTFSKVYGAGSGTSFCNIEPRAGDVTHGIIVWAEPVTLSHLDRFEGFPVHYDRIEVPAFTEDGEEVAAQVYVSDHIDHTVRPGDLYYRGVLDGLRRYAQAPESYLRRVAANGRPSKAKTRTLILR